MTAEWYPYRTAAARDECRRYLDRLAGEQWPIVSEERMIPTSFGQTFVRVSGPPGAPTVVLLHGAAATSLMWAGMIENLSREHRTVAVDQIGEFGKSICVKRPLILEDLMTWLTELVDTLGAQRVSVAGMSYGGALAAQFARRFPERVERLVLLAPGATVLWPPFGFWARLGVLAVARERGMGWFFRWVFPAMARQDPAWIRSTLELLRTNMRNVERHRVPVPPVMSDAEWGSLRPRTLFLVGEDEVIYSSARAAVRRLNRVAPQVTAEIIPGAGHDLPFAQPAAVTERVLRFFRSDTAAAVR